MTMHPKSPRSTASQTALLAAVLVSNFGGVTGALLSLDGGKLAGALKADALFPVAGYKRCLDTQNGYGMSLQPLMACRQLILKMHSTNVKQSTKQTKIPP